LEFQEKKKIQEFLDEEIISMNIGEDSQHIVLSFTSK